VLYNSEEFQVLRDFLNSLRMQKEAEIWGYQSNFNGKEPKSAEAVKTDMAVLLAQRNLIAMIETLPTAIASIEMVLEKQKQQAVAFAKAQEG